MKNLILSLSIVILVLAPASSIASELLILQSNHSQPISQLTRLVQNSCNYSNRTLVISDYSELDLFRVIREERPTALLAIGDSALSAARKIRNIPVLFSMVLDAHEDQLPPNFTGISMIVSPDRYMKVFTALNLSRVGVIYNKDHTGPYLRRAREAAARSGVELVALQAASPKEIPALLGELARRKVDSVWLLPDKSIVTALTVDSYFTFSQSINLPVIAFASSYLNKGAVASIDVTLQDICRRICNKLSLLVEGKIQDSPKIIDPNAGKILTNKNVANRIGLDVSRLTKLAGTGDE